MRLALAADPSSVNPIFHQMPGETLVLARQIVGFSP
jgi:hypothetical protein